MGVAEARLLQTLPVAKARQRRWPLVAKARFVCWFQFKRWFIHVRRPCVREVGWLSWVGGWAACKNSRFRTCLSKPRLRESPGFWTSKPGIIPKPFSIQRPSRDDRRQPGSSPHTVPLPCPPTTSVPCTMRTHGPPSCCLPAAFLLPSCCLPAALPRSHVA